MQTDMQIITNENVQTLTNYANKSGTDTNTTKTFKGQIINTKAAQTAVNEKNSNLTGQVGNTRQDYSMNNKQQRGWYNQRKYQ